MKKWLLLFAATAAMTEWILLLPQMETVSAQAVTVVQVTSGAYTETVDCAGTLKAASEETVSYGFSLRPAKILVSEGDRVQAGQTLMTVDRDQTLTALTLAQGTAGSASAAALADETSSAAVSSDVASRLAQALGDWVPGASSAASQSSDSLNALLQQYAALAGTSAASRLEEQLAAQTASSSDSSGTSSASSSASAADTLAAIAAQVPQQVTAPAAGVITQVNAQEGAFTEAGQSLFVISDTDALELVGEVDAGEIARVQTGQSASVTVSGTAYTGSVVKIAPQAHESTGGTSKSVVDVTVCLQQPYNGLMPNLSAAAAIAVSTGKTAVAVPYEAVCEDESGQEYVWAVENGRVRRRNVKTGTELKNTVQVLSGLSSGARLVLSPADSLRAGDAVTVRGVKNV